MLHILYLIVIAKLLLFACLSGIPITDLSTNIPDIEMFFPE